MIYVSGELSRGSSFGRIDNLLDVEASGWGLGGILGALWEINDNGVVDEISSLSIPDADRDWYAAGFSVNFSPKSALDFGLAFIVGEEEEVTESGALPPSLAVGR